MRWEHYDDERREYGWYDDDGRWWRSSGPQPAETIDEE